MATATLPTTLRPSFSFYMDSNDQRAIETYAAVADAVTLRGSGGPSAVIALRRTDWSGCVLFDRAAYQHPETHIDAHSWFDEQLSAGADRLLTPGRWVDWTQNKGGFEAAVGAEFDLASGIDATVMLALDYRWLTKGHEIVAKVLRELRQPAAIALGSTGDPLAANGAVNGLISIVRQVPNLTILRADHGAIGATAFGASHASIGLKPATRHAVPPGKKSFGKQNDRTARVFVWALADWFTAATIAGWSAANVRLRCDLPCCSGASLDRFLDDGLKAAAANHNRTTIAHFADYILNAPEHDRVRLFAGLCQNAVLQYEHLGPMAPEPKGQLSEWALWA